MNSAGVVNAIKKYGLIVGPEFEPGCKNPQPIIGWSVYENWINATDDTFSTSMMANQRALASAKYLSLAVHQAVKKIKARRTKRQRDYAQKVDRPAMSLTKEKL